MKNKQILIMIAFLIIPFWANAESDIKQPVIILYTDGEKTIDLNDMNTITSKTNRIIYHILHNVLPQKYNIPIKLKPVSWSRGLNLIKSGLADGIINASYNSERAGYAVYPMKNGKPDPAKRLKGIAYYLYKNKNSSIEWDGHKITNIDGDIGAVKSYAIVKDLHKMGIDVKEFQFAVRIIKDLAIGKLKAAGMQDYSADEYIKQASFSKENIIKFEKPLKKKDYYLIFSKEFYLKNRETAENIWNKMEEYSRSPEYERLRRDFEK